MIINIPNVEREARIGSAFNGLFDVIHATETADIYQPLIWDFSNNEFFHPFFICGLALYKKSINRVIQFSGLKSATRNYLDLISFDNPISIFSVAKVAKIMDGYSDKSYLPICRFSSDENISDAITSGLQKVIERQVNAPARLTTPLSYLLGELIGNITDHSQREDGFLFSQYLSREKALHICIADFGITVHGSFVSSKKFSPAALADEGTVLNMALGEKSTKNRPQAENRGYGLPTSKEMLVDGLGGEFFILSGGAFHRHDKNGATTVTLPPEIQWNGTIVLLKIPINPPKDFNYLNYI